MQNRLGRQLWVRWCHRFSWKLRDSNATLEKSSVVFIFQNYSRQVLHVQKEGGKWKWPLHLEREAEKKEKKTSPGANWHHQPALKDCWCSNIWVRNGKKYQTVAISSCAFVRAPIRVFLFVVNLLYFRRELQYDSDRLRPATELHLWVTRAGLKPRHYFSYILNIDEAKKKKRNTAGVVVVLRSVPVGNVFATQQLHQLTQHDAVCCCTFCWATSGWQADSP